jgi:release factor glutamine methyltransferase
MIYAPAEDSYLLSEELKKYLSKIKDREIRQQKPRGFCGLKVSPVTFKILDIGSGSGIQAETCKNSGFENVLAADIDKESVGYLKSKGFKAIQSDLFSRIRESFDLIILNPPYLPRDEREPKESQKSTTGGKKGDEIILKFIEQVAQHLNKDGKILLLLSSFTPKERIVALINSLKLKHKQIASKKLFFETLEVWLISAK